MAVSTGKVMRCSVSSGEYPGARVLIWTWTLVMSGTASIGRRWKFQAPKATAPSASKRTSQRCCSETAMRRSIMLGLALAHLRLHDEAVFRDVMLSGRKAGPDLDMARIGIAKLH